MLACELDYELPEALIAQRPPLHRDGGRMLVLDDPVQHDRVVNFAERVPSNSLVVLNDTRVIKARLFGQREPSGARVELLLLNPFAEQPEQPEQHVWQALVRSNRRLSSGDTIAIGEVRITLGERQPDGTRLIRCATSLEQLCAQRGHVPLPPYVRRADEAQDETRYQTVFAKHAGSAAAPTAGLHLTTQSIARLSARGVELGYVTLHVGAGTFKPVSVDVLDDHPMHAEQYSVSSQLAQQVSRARQAGRPVVAVGTTVVRALESAANEHGYLVKGERSTSLLIQPGYGFRVVDGLLTNFHAPRSTLLALVYAFAGRERVRRAYHQAVAERYRFLSYGDAMWIPRRYD